MRVLPLTGRRCAGGVVVKKGWAYLPGEGELAEFEVDPAFLLAILILSYSSNLI